MSLNTRFLWLIFVGLSAMRVEARSRSLGVYEKTELFVRSILRQKGIPCAYTIPIDVMPCSKGINACVSGHCSIWFPNPSFYVTEWLNDHIALLDREEDFVDEVCSYRASPYTVTVRFDREELRAISRAIIEHEAGHLFYKHLKIPDSKLGLAGMTVLSTGVATASAYSFFEDYEILKRSNSSVDANTATEGMVQSALTFFFSTGTALWCGKAWNKGKFQASIEKEKEADAFVSDDPKLLYALARFFHILSVQRHYVESYQSLRLRFHAKWNHMKPHEYYEKYADWCDRTIFDPSASHPTYRERIEALKVRLAKLEGVKPEHINIEGTANRIVTVTQKEKYSKKALRKAKQARQKEKCAQKRKHKWGKKR